MPSGRILISGASGLIGRALVSSLQADGYEVVRLVRSANPAPTQIPWDPAQPLSPQSVSGFDAVVHLAGESIAGRWTPTRMRNILNSRADGTRHLCEALAAAAQPPRVLVSASAVGYYGTRGDEFLSEESSAGTGFATEICLAWEAATRPAAAAGMRVAQMRIGLVLSAQGGALPKMLPAFRAGIGGNMGNGRQWWSWIDLRDLVNAIRFTLQNESLHGPVNAVSPNPVTNAQFTKTLAAAVHRAALLPMPVFAVRLAFGQMGVELMLASQRVQPNKLLAAGFTFQHPDLQNSLQEILKK
jgi:uncharacterized protein (TIGR01777 family)